MHHMWNRLNSKQKGNEMLSLLLFKCCITKILISINQERQHHGTLNEYLGYYCAVHYWDVIISWIYFNQKQCLSTFQSLSPPRWSLNWIKFSVNSPDPLVSIPFSTQTKVKCVTTWDQKTHLLCYAICWTIKFISNGCLRKKERLMM
jgi:hypothetical protein